jgi:hypothetical protein
MGGSRSKHSKPLKFDRGIGSGQDKINIAKAQFAQTVPGKVNTPWRLKNKDKLDLAKAGARNLVEGTIEKNRAKRKKAKKKG